VGAASALLTLELELEEELCDPAAEWLGLPDGGDVVLKLVVTLPVPLFVRVVVGVDPVITAPVEAAPPPTMFTDRTLSTLLTLLTRSDGRTLRKLLARAETTALSVILSEKSSLPRLDASAMREDMLGFSSRPLS